MHIAVECKNKHENLDVNCNFTRRTIHEKCCDQCKYARSNGHFAPSMWCIKHKTNDGEFFIAEYGGGTGCDDFEELKKI